ncbi:MAG: restriction endonuclease [Chloroflexi bacterium]|nr:restriction endonuclease [Chloroflexota bacterium]
MHDLTPTAFENVVYDLVCAAGLRNAVWRTPGADGGRDIEGEYSTVDFSGFHTVVRWYVECKRYDKAVDWPTVWGKIAYAENHEADYLLIVTTAPLSPQCKTEISKRNAKERHPKVRFWDASDLEQVLLRYPVVLVKHGVSNDSRLVAASFMSLAQHCSKVVQAAYGVSEFADHNNPPLEAAAALSELLTVRLRDAETVGRSSCSPFVLAADGYPWLKVADNASALGGFDRYGLRAMLTLIRHITPADELVVVPDKTAVRLTIPTHHARDVATSALLVEVATWADTEVRADATRLVIVARTANEQ